MILCLKINSFIKEAFISRCYTTRLTRDNLYDKNSKFSKTYKKYVYIHISVLNI